MDKVIHTIEPFVFSDAKVLILGSIPSPKSRETGFYYGHPQNRFWKVMAGAFGESVPVSIEEKKAFLKGNRVALWDVLASCEIEGASDASIKNPVVNDIVGAIKHTKIKKIFTTGKTAYLLLKKYLNIESVCLPSPSPANCAMKTEKLIEYYSQIKKEVLEIE